MIEKYREFLKQLDEEVDALFEDQKEFIKCYKGCGSCCNESYYKICGTEYEFLKEGLKKLFTEEERKAFKKKSFDIIEQRKKFVEKNPDKDSSDFKYQCVFLIDQVCSIYEYRPLICRTYGLPRGTSFADMRLPKCTSYGLNYAQVYDTETNLFVVENFKKYNITTTPKFIDYKDILKKALFQNIIKLDFDFIEKWIAEDDSY